MNIAEHKHKIRITLISIVLALAILFGGCAVYLRNYYRADNEAIGAFLPQDTMWKEKADGTIVFEPEAATRDSSSTPAGRWSIRHIFR